MGSIISLSIIQSALELGFIYSLIALALFISYSILDIADLSTDGCFTLGCAVCAMFTIAGHPVLGLFAARLGTTIAERLSGYLEYGLINTIIEIENLYFNSGGSNSAHKPPTSFNKESRECEQKGVK